MRRGGGAGIEEEGEVAGRWRRGGGRPPEEARRQEGVWRQEGRGIRVVGGAAGFI
jgi:hypothetical protein